MSKPIKLTEKLIESMQSEFVEALKNSKMSDGKITYTKSFVWKEPERVTITFKDKAYRKMMALVDGFSTEVAWHGIVDRTADREFTISDIEVYPQIVTGGNVDTDEGKYTKWLIGHDDEIFSKIRMQGHSHVNFAVTPSPVDLAHQEEILSQLKDTAYYIFIIWNKRGEKTIKVYDMGSNTLYETADVDVVVEGKEEIDSFVKSAREVVEQKTYPVTTPASTGYSQSCISYSDSEKGYGAGYNYRDPYYKRTEWDNSYGGSAKSSEKKSKKGTAKKSVLYSSEQDRTFMTDSEILKNIKDHSDKFPDGARFDD